MAVQHIHTYLVHPGKGAAEPTSINGAQVPLSGRMFELLGNIYVRSDQECDIGITFNPTVDGKQQNDCRDLVCGYLEQPTLATGRVIAERLEKHTDGRSGLGLLFLIAGKEGRDHKIVISRFPTDNAIYVDENPRNLTVQFLERVFMKNKASYKAVAYKDASLRAGFWSGRAIDKQLNNPAGEFSNYWILDFLASQLTVTAAMGTRRLATALRNAAKKSDLTVKQEITAAATLAAGLDGQRFNINEFEERFGLSHAARAAITGELKTPYLAQERFAFDVAEFQTVIAFKSVELSNGGTLTAPSAEFDDVFHQEAVGKLDGQVRFTTEGRVVNEQLKSRA
ncbi:MAG TPA: hypothetical protein VHT51_18790 [Micropepsaceae bacterium]|jgi:hypothetical protein|nr:hypothetical protein [Micropepsaceae bacterium]